MYKELFPWELPIGKTELVVADFKVVQNRPDTDRVLFLAKFITDQFDFCTFVWSVNICIDGSGRRVYNSFVKYQIEALLRGVLDKKRFPKRTLSGASSNLLQCEVRSSSVSLSSSRRIPNRNGLRDWKWSHVNRRVSIELVDSSDPSRRTMPPA